MESDSTLSALALAVSALLLAISEAGAAAIAAALRAPIQQASNGSPSRARSLGLLTNLPGGPTASLRLVSLAALAASMLSAAVTVASIWGARWDLVAVYGVAALAALMVVTFLARGVGIRNSDAMLGVSSRAAWLLSFPFRPVLLLHSYILHSLASDQTAPDMDFEISVDTHDEPLDEYEMRMIRGVVRLDKTVAREIMVPRVDIVAVESSESLDALAEEMNSAGHSRVPVFERDLDRVSGIAHARDVLQKLVSGCDPSKITARDVCRDPLFIPESKTLEELLEEFQQKRTHLAVVVDEYGGVSGIVTIEDLLEEIVGEIRDEFDTEESEIQSLSPSRFLVDARVPIDDLNETLGVQIVGDGFDTIGGLVFDQLGKIPVAGDTVEYGRLSIEVISTIGRRPTSLIVRVASAER